MFYISQTIIAQKIEYEFQLKLIQLKLIMTNIVHAINLVI